MNNKTISLDDVLKVIGEYDMPIDIMNGLIEEINNITEIPLSTNK